MRGLATPSRGGEQMVLKGMHASLHPVAHCSWGDLRALYYPLDYSPQAHLSMGSSRQEYWSRLPFPSPGDLPNPGVKPTSLALQMGSLPAEPLGKTTYKTRNVQRN